MTAVVRRLSPLLAVLLLAGCGPLSSQPAQQNTVSTEPPMTSHQDETALPASAAPSAAALQDPTQLYAEIKAMVGTAAASEPAQCRKVGLGHKPCGGPASYLIYSTQGVDEALLLQKVSQYNLLIQAEQQRLGLVSDCAVVPEPGVALVGGFCVASAPGETY